MPINTKPIVYTIILYTHLMYWVWLLLIPSIHVRTFTMQSVIFCFVAPMFTMWIDSEIADTALWICRRMNHYHNVMRTFDSLVFPCSFVWCHLSIEYWKKYRLFLFPNALIAWQNGTFFNSKKKTRWKWCKAKLNLNELVESKECHPSQCKNWKIFNENRIKT